VTGPKTDLWLVKTVGVLLAFIGATLLFAGMTENVTAPIVVVGAGSAVGLAIVEVNYAFKRVISPIYLLDAVIEIILIRMWIRYI
jgi:hypothetical protein